MTAMRGRLQTAMNGASDPAYLRSVPGVERVAGEAVEPAGLVETRGHRGIPRRGVAHRLRRDRDSGQQGEQLGQ